MKKKIILLTTILIFCTLFFCMSSPVFALPEHPFNLQMSLGTAANFYGDEAVNTYRSNYFASDSSRFILDGEIGVGFFLDEYICLTAGSILSFDWFKHVYYDTASGTTDSGTTSVVKNSMFLLDYDIFFGVRVYPFLLGFCFGVDYITGGCTNFLKIAGVKSSENEGWANGFRLIFEYNILNNRIGWSPAVGVYWQNMSRVGGHDNKVAVYIKAALR